jgi:succinate dehydrogenase hydrophobic anchor subunit
MDYVTRPGWRVAITLSFYTIGFFLMVLGTIIIVTFDPAKWPGAV